MKEKSYLNDAASHLRSLTEDEKIQLQCEARERYYLDMSSARSEGEPKGIKQGTEQTRLEIARNLPDTLDADTIAQKVNLPVEMVLSLKYSEEK